MRLKWFLLMVIAGYLMDGIWNDSLAFGVAASAQVPDKKLSSKPNPKSVPSGLSNEAKDNKVISGRGKRYLVAQGAESSEPTASVINKIKFQGNKKIEKEALLAKLESKEGALYSLNSVKADVRALFALGYFYDIIVDKEASPTGVTLTYVFVEKPTIGELTFSGNQALDEDELKEAVGLKAFEILDYSRIQAGKEKLEKMYEEKGFYLARIKTEVEPISGSETVAVKYEIQENDKVMVKKITFLGNTEIDDGTLKSVMQTQEGGFFSFLSGSGSYKEEVFERDRAMLNLLYYNKGYVRARVERPQVQISPDKKSIYLTLSVYEGDKYQIGSVDFQGDLLFSDSELLEITKIEKGDDFGWDKVQIDRAALTAKYGDLGYAFVNVIPNTVIHDDAKTVDISWEFEKGDKVYFGQINVVGNTRTRDKVIRRELKIREGELYNETRKRESEANITRLGFFEEVRFNTKANAQRPDVLDVDIVVKERSTGSLHVGAGYSSSTSFILNGQLSEINMFGRGQKVSVTLNYSGDQQEFNVNFTEPYVADTLWSLGFDLYNQSRKVGNYYSELKTGGAIRIGHPLAENFNGILRYKLDNTELKLLEGDPAIYTVNTANGVTSSLTMTFEYDTRNDRFSPSGGIFNSLSLEYAGLGGDIAYTKGMASARYFKKVFWDVVWRNNLSYGFIQPNDSSDVPFNQLFLLGGPFNLRGFEQFTLGTKKFSTKACDAVGPTTGCVDENNQGSQPWNVNLPYGGRQQFFYNLEFEFPLIQEVGMKGVVFYDLGNAEDEIDLTSLRSDVGFGFRWFSPIGPLRFEWGFPIDRRVAEGEVGYQFYFTIGSPF